MSARVETVEAGAVSLADVDAAYRRCEQIARSHYENFPVVSRFLPRSSRRALAAVYAFARTGDDFADEGHVTGGPTAEARLGVLDEWERRLRLSCGLERESSFSRDETRLATAGLLTAHAREIRSAAAGASSNPKNQTNETSGARTIVQSPFVGRHDADAIFLALEDTIAAHALDPALFLDLLSAFRQDVTVGRYERRVDLLDYCRRSANPVGRIVLGVHGAHDERRAELSDAICTGLQLANFWQDVGIDAAKGRLYLPGEDLARHGVADEDLSAATASARLRALVLEEAAWARTFFQTGRLLLDEAPAGLGFHLRLVWLGGMRILEMIEEAGGDVLGRRPSLGAAGAARLALRALFGGGAR